MFAVAMGAGLLHVGFMLLLQGADYLISVGFRTHSAQRPRPEFQDERDIASLLEARRLPGVDWAEPTLEVACTLVNGSHRKRGGITG